MLFEESADLDGPKMSASGHSLVERSQKRDSAVGIVFPAILAVQDHRNERRRVMPACVADRGELGHEVAGGHRPGAPLVVKPDLVRHRVVAENDRQLVVRFAHLPGTIEQLGMANMAAAVAADLAMGRASQDLFIGRDPLRCPACASRGMIAWETEPSLGHMPRGPFAEVADVALDRAAHLHGGVVGVSAAIARQGDVGHGLARGRFFDQQRQNRVIERRRGQLDLAPRGQLRDAAE